MQIIVKDLGSYIKTKRKELGLTIEEVSERMDVSKGYISRIENNNSNPSFETLAKFSNVLMFPLQDISDMSPSFGEGEEVDLEEVIQDCSIRLNGRRLNHTEKYKLVQIVQIIDSFKKIDSNGALLQMSKLLLATEQFKKEGERKK